MSNLAILLLLPLFSGLVYPYMKSTAQQYVLLGITVVPLIFITIGLLSIPNYHLLWEGHNTLSFLFLIADMLLLLFFAYVGYRHRNMKVALLAIAQLVLYGIIEMTLRHIDGVLISIDRLSIIMFGIINIVGGLIVVYAQAYMHDEKLEASQRARFMALLLFFIVIMNSIVVVNSLLLFFFLFELTTLFSYLLIRFRNDETAIDNALRALWMNQIGGLGLLAAIFAGSALYNTFYIDVLLQQGFAPAVVVFLAFSAFVKAAALPFDRWLLGAMVAPTPVSAMLHSATMVKIAPFMILKFSPLLGSVGVVVGVIGALVFAAASYIALSKTLLKEILGYSTIALLGLMMALGASGTQEGYDAALVLMVFHALAKALLFLVAGWLEKRYGFKDVYQMQALSERSMAATLMLLFGFMALTLPPFGLFMGKVLAIESTALLLHTSALYLIVLLGILMGSALLVLLYFKVASFLLSHRDDTQILPRDAIDWGYALPLYVLAFIQLGMSLYLLATWASFWSVFIGIMALLLLGALLLWRWIGRFDRAKPYHCGESSAFEQAFYQMQLHFYKSMQYGFILLFGILLGVGVLL